MKTGKRPRYEASEVNVFLGYLIAIIHVKGTGTNGIDDPVPLTTEQAQRPMCNVQ